MAKITTTKHKLFILASLFYLLGVTKVQAADGEVQIDILSKPEACETVAHLGDTISMHYKGNLYDVATKQVGEEFDSNFDSSQTFDFKLGAGQVIEGWEKGVPGMCVGERRKLIIPPELAYGDVGFTDLIPPKSTLVFEIELVNVKAADEDDLHNGIDHDQNAETFSAIDADGDKQISREEMFDFIKKFSDEGTDEQKIEDIEAIVDEIFLGDDKNKDGVISLEEYQKMTEGDSTPDGEDSQKEEL